MSLRLYNTLTRSKEAFRPIDPAHVRMYVCGPTVYDRAHIGNARPVVVFDTLFRLLRHVYGADHVTYVRNFTDVDDKINATAQARKAAGDARPLEALIRERTPWSRVWMNLVPRISRRLSRRGASVEKADIAALNRATDSVGLAVFAPAAASDYQLVVRAFCPADNIPEDPVTGSANAAIAAYLHQCGALAPIGNPYTASQGRELGRDGLVQVRVDDEGEVWIGGKTQTVINGTMDWESRERA